MFRVFINSYPNENIIYENSHHVLIYANTIESAKKIIIYIKLLIDKLYKRDDIFYSKYTSDMNNKIKGDVLANFKMNKLGILTTVYSLGEGVDIPILDGVLFSENMTSNTRIIQSALRGSRKNINDKNKITKIMIPIYENEVNINKIINYIKAEDEDIVRKIEKIELDTDNTILNTFESEKLIFNTINNVKNIIPNILHPDTNTINTDTNTINTDTNTLNPNKCKRISKICKECKKDLPLSEFTGTRGKCKECYNLERKIKREDKSKNINLIPIVFINHIDNDSTENIRIQKHLSEIENLSQQDKDIKILLFILNTLDKNKISYIVIGRIFYSIYLGTNVGLNAWIEYSTNYNIDTSTFKNLYGTFNANPEITIKNLFYYLKINNLDFYNKYKILESNNIYVECLSLTNNAIAKALYNYFRLEFYYCNDTNTWYYFDGEILEKDNRNNYLKNNIIKYFIPIFKKIKISIELCNKYTQKEKDIKTLELSALIKKLETNTFINQCIKSSSNLFMIKNIINELDNKKYVLEIID